MTPKEIQTELQSWTCPKHGSHPYVRIVNGKLSPVLCCCESFRESITLFAEQQLQIYYQSQEGQEILAHPISEEKFNNTIASIRNLASITKEIKDNIEKTSFSKNASFRQQIGSAKRALRRIYESKRADETLIEELLSIIKDAEETSKAAKKAIVTQERIRIEKVVTNQKEHEKLLKAIKKERQREAAAKKRQEAKAEKERIKIIQANLPQWVKSVENAQKFIDKNYSQAYLASLSKDDLHSVVMVANTLLEAMIPLRNARNEKIIGSDYAYLLRAYNIALEKILNITEICSRLISRKSISNRKRTIEKQKNNKREDKSYFWKMHRLYDDRIHATDKWYENESRRFNINRHEDVREYLEAYGRTIRNSLIKAEIVIEGKEDIDEWGYFILGDNRYLPYCLREVKVVYDNIEYHLYTFNAQTSMDDYDYDGIITDRILYLQNRGIRTN